MTTVRLLAYNVQGFRHGARTVAAAIADQQPDVAFINEIGRGRALARFARALGCDVASGLSLFRSVPNAVLCRPPWRILDKRVLRFSRTGRLIPRGAVVAQLGRSGARLSAASVHLGLSDRERERHVRELTDALAGMSGRLVVGGDWNEGPGSTAASWMAERFWDAYALAGDEPGYTFPSNEPRSRIDYLFLGEGLKVRRAWVLDGEPVRAVADHLPVFADVELEDPG